MWIVGEYPCHVAADGWLDIPDPLQHVVHDGCVVTRGLERCVLLFPPVAWEQFVAKLHGNDPFGRRHSRRLVRLIMGGASNEMPGEFPGVQLPERLRQYGSLDGEVVLVGVGTHVEIWNSTAWSAHLEQVLQYAEEDAEALTLLPG